MISTVGMVLKRGSPQAVEAALAAMSHAPDRRYLVQSDGYHAPREPVGSAVAVATEEFTDACDLVLVLGGDGTLIYAASLFQRRVVPILGVNLGRIGFLTEVAVEELQEAMALALAERLRSIDRMRLEVQLLRRGKPVLGRQVLNDAVVGQLGLARIAEFRLSYGGEALTSVRGDGVIISTPTGSTAYSMAAGGPVLAPELQSLIVTPICPHGLTQRPIVLSPQRAVEITLHSDTTVFVTLDGQLGYEFSHDDVLRITAARFPSRLLESPSRSFFQTLRNKLSWGED